ncbi:peptide deformylase [Puteibacter caeruleilacunae]|nr:peptide deformylase [Puteibacter caeruleilacunae]
MILPIVPYGNTTLRQQCSNITSFDDQLNNLIDDMWHTMNKANGCGLAAPQVNKPINLFIVDTIASYQMLDNQSREELFATQDTGIEETFINARIIDRSGNSWSELEGCLSIPGLSQQVKRPWSITIEYYNRNNIRQVKTFEGYTARVIQHEYDHLEGKLYIDHLSRLSHKLLHRKLKRIVNRQVVTDYPML